MFKCGNAPWNKGLKSCYSSQTLEKMRCSHLNKKPSAESNQKRSEKLKGKKFREYGPLSEEHKKAISFALSGKPKEKSHKEKLSKAKKGVKFSENHIKNLISSRQKRTDKPNWTLEARKKQSEKQKVIWKNEEYAKKSIKRIFKQFNTKPNKSEIKLDQLIQKTIPNEYEINVKANIMVLGGKVPDFVNINGKKKLIELYGNYWHKGDDPENRINYFKQFGWDTLIIWENELNNTNILAKKILEFNC